MYTRGPLAAPHVDRRASAVVQCRRRPHVDRRPEATDPAGGRPVLRRGAAASARQAGPHRPLAGERAVRARLAHLGEPGPGLRRPMVTGNGARHPPPHARRRRRQEGGVLMSEPRVALVHDFLSQRGGAERVVLELAKAWPGAPLYTSIYDPEATFEGFKSIDVRTTAMQTSTDPARFRRAVLRYPRAFRALDLSDYDLVVVS